MDKKTVSLTQLIRNLRGGSQPILARASDGHIYVVKFRNNLQGPNVLFNETMGYELYRAGGLPVPPWKPLLVTDAFLDQNQDCWHQTESGRLRPESGVCFGSRFLGEGDERLLEILPQTSFGRIQNGQSFWLAWLIDVCAGHTDNRQAIFKETADGFLIAYFIDQGHLFGGPKGEQSVPFRASRYLDPRIYLPLSSNQRSDILKVVGSIDADELLRFAKEMPDSWKTVSAFGRFTDCLSKLSNPAMLENILETFVDSIERDRDCDFCRQDCGRKRLDSVLRTGVQAAKLEHGSIAEAVDYPARAQRR